MIFHRHRWIETDRKVVEGALETGRGFEGRPGSEVARDAIYGYTIVELRCEKCGDVRRRKLTGSTP